MEESGDAAHWELGRRGVGDLFVPRVLCGGASPRDSAAAVLGDGGCAPVLTSTSKCLARPGFLRIIENNMRILGVLFLASTVAFGGGLGPDINTLSPCDNVSVFSDLTTSSGCAVDPFTIFNASFIGPSGSPASTAGDIAFDISYGGGNLGISFGGNFLLPSGVPNPPGYAEYVIQYTIDPPPPVILGFEMDAEWSEGSSDFRLAGPESFLVQALTPAFEVYTDLCVGGDFDIDSRNRCTSTTYGPLFLDPNQLFDSVFFTAPTNWVSVRHRIRVYQDVNLFVNNNAPLREGEVPEPGTWVLMGMGVALVLFGRRRR